MNITEQLDRIEQRIASAPRWLRWCWRDPVTALLSGMAIGVALAIVGTWVLAVLGSLK